MAGDGAAERPGPGPPEDPGEAELVARVAALEVSLAGKEAEVEQAAAELAARAARAERERAELAKAKDDLAWFRMLQDPAWRDWGGGLPDEVLAKVAGKVVAQTEAGWAAQLKERPYYNEEEIQEKMAKRERDGNCLFVFAMVCKEWRKAQLKVGGPLRTRVWSDVILPGSVELAKWALAEECPTEESEYYNMAHAAAHQGHLELVRWLIQEQGFAMEEGVMNNAARSGNLELVKWLRGEGCDWCTWTCKWAAGAGHLEVLQWLHANDCPWDGATCHVAVDSGHVEVLRWARENGCPWTAYDRDRAAEKLGYTDDLGNLEEEEEWSEDEFWSDDE